MITVKRRNFSAKFHKPKSQMTDKEIEQDEIYNGDTVMEKILNSKKIRYELLNELFHKIPDKYHTVTMYIDLYSILNNLYNPNVLNSISTFDEEKKIIMSSNLVNMAAHFRNYFATRQGKYTNFVFYYSLEESKYETENDENYRKDFYFKRFSKNSEFLVMNKIMQENIKLCEIMSDYLPHIYFLNSKEINPLLIPYYYIQYSSDDELSIIYSNDKMNMLSCLNSKHPAYLLSSNFGNVTLKSEDDFLKTYANSKTFDAKNYHVNPKLLPLLFAISGNKKYNIDGIKGYGPTKTLNLIEKMLNENKLSNISYTNKELLMSDLEKSQTFNQEQLNIIGKNLDNISPSYMMDKLSKVDILKTFDVKDLIDMNSLIEINNEYYEKYPLMLDELMLGEDY